MHFSHITIQTNKAVEEIEFYKTWAGLNIIKKFGSITFLGNGDSTESMIEIIEKEEKAINAPGLSIGFETEDVESLRKGMLEVGLQPTEFIKPMPSVCFFFVKDPAGLNVQFMERNII